VSRKIFVRVAILALFLLTLFGIPFSAQAGGVCGGTYIVEAGETIDSIAARCGTTVAAIYAANPGIGSTLYAGQSLMVPGIHYATAVTPTPTPVSYSGTYTVQYGDTFSGIASRFGVTVSQLWAANPQVWNINVLYVGQVLYIPSSSWFVVVPTSAMELVPLSWGTVPSGAPEGKVKLSNQARSDVYVSLQGTTRDGLTVIREYPVNGSMTVKVPAGWYVYVAWVGGVKLAGEFNLRKDADVAITFYRNKVVVE
jgi:LysM repeat protein